MHAVDHPLRHQDEQHPDGQAAAIKGFRLRAVEAWSQRSPTPKPISVACWARSAVTTQQPCTFVAFILGPTHF